MSKKCLKCNAEMPDEAIFCAMCGSKDLSDMAAPVAEPAPVVAEPVVEAAPEAAPAAVEEPVAAPVVEAAPEVAAAPIVEAAPVVEQVAAPEVAAAPEAVAVEAPVVEAAAEPVAEAPVAESSDNGKKKKKKKRTLLKVFVFAVIPLLLVASIVCAIIFPGIYTAVGGFAVKLFGNEEQYMRFVEQQSIKAFANDFGDYYEKALKNLSDGISETGKLSVVLSEDAQKSITDAMGQEIELDWINNLSATVDVNFKGNLYSSAMSLMIDNKTLASIDTIFDFGEGDMYLSLGDLTDKVIKGDFETTALTPEVIVKAAPDAKVVKKLAEKYAKIIFQNISDVSEEKEEFSVKGVEQKLTTLTYGISEETVFDITKAVLKELKDDKDVKNIIKDAQKVLVDAGVIESGNYYDDFKKSIEKALDTMKDNDDLSDDVMIELVTYVNAASEIVGRRLVFQDQNIAEYVTVRDGSEVGVKYVLYGKKLGLDGNITIAGSGEVKDYKLNIDFDVKFGDKKMATVKVTDYDIKAAEEGYLNCNLKIALDKDLWKDAIADGGSNVISTLELEIAMQIESSENNSKIAVDFLNKGKSYIGIVYEGTKNKATEISVPNSNIVDADDIDDISELITMDDLKAILNKLKGTSFPEEYITAIESLIEYYSQPQYDDYYDDYYGDDFYYGSQDFGTGTVIPDDSSSNGWY